MLILLVLSVFTVVAIIVGILIYHHNPNPNHHRQDNHD